MVAAPNHLDVDQCVCAAHAILHLAFVQTHVDSDSGSRIPVIGFIPSTGAVNRVIACTAKESLHGQVTHDAARPPADQMIGQGRTRCLVHATERVRAHNL